MSIESQDVFLNKDNTLSVIGGGGGAVSTFSTFTVSSLNALNITTGFINSANISSIFGEFDEVFCSSISTLGIILDDQILTAVGSELLLNGVPVATISSLSSIADWSLSPAISTLNMNAQSSINGSLLSTLTINAGSASITNLVCSDISTTTLTVLSTVHVLSTISSVTIEAQSGTFSSINGVQFPQVTASFDNASVSSLTVSSINNISYPPPNSDTSQWAKFPAVSTVFGGSGSTDDLNLVATRYITNNARSVTIKTDGGSDIGTNSFFAVSTMGGAAGQISLTANPGYNGNYGRIVLTANGGTVAGVGVGGLIELDANTPLGTEPAATSAIKFSAAGINSYAGAVPSFGSLLGYNFIFGSLGVNLCAGSPSILPNTPGTIYLYGTTGITLGSQTNTGANDITQSSGGLYTTLVTGYWAGGSFSPQNLLIRGRQIPLIGNSYVSLSNVDVLSFDSGGSGAINNVQTINGSAYPPTFAVPTNLVVSTLTAANQISTPSLFISSINNSAYPPTFAVPENIVVSTLLASTSVTAPSMLCSTLASTEGGIISFQGGGGMTLDGAGGDVVIGSGSGSFAVNTQAFLSSDLFVSSIQGVSSINGYSVENPVVSTLTVMSSINAPYIVSKRITIPGDVDKDTSGIVLEKSASAPDVSQGIWATCAPAGGVSFITSILRQQTVDSSNVAWMSQEYESLFTAPSTIGNLAGRNLFIGNNGVNWASISASPDTSTIIMSGNLSISSLTDVSSINGISYPPPAVVGIQSTISNAGSFVNVDATGNIALSTLVGTRANITLDADNNVTVQCENGGIYLLNNNVTTSVTLDNTGNVSLTASGTNSIVLDSNGGININAVGPGTVNINNLSTINGAPYPPSASVGTDLVVSTLTAATFVSTTQLLLSSINSIGFADGNIDAQSITAEVGFTLAGAGTFTINGNAGAEGQVIQISGGYPEWGNVSTVTQPQQFYSTHQLNLPIYSTFSTIIETTFTTQTSTGTGFATATISWLNDGDTSIGDNLTTAFILGGTVVLDAISTTSVFANGYQTVTLQQAITNNGVPQTIGITMQKPNTDNVYTIQTASLNIITDLK